MIDNDVNLARIATALERLANAVDDATRTPVRPIATGARVIPPPNVPSEAIPPTTMPPPPGEPRREFQFSASAGARLREGDKHDAEHKGVKPGRNGGLYCPTKLGDGTWCPWRQAA